MKAPMVKVGIIGAGFAADLHASAIQQLAGEMEVVAVASRTEASAGELAARYGVPGCSPIIANCCANRTSIW